MSGATSGTMLEQPLRSYHASDDLLFLQRFDLRRVVADRRQYIFGVGAEQRRRAVVLDRGAGEGDGVADQRQIRLEWVIDLDPHAARLNVRIGEHLLEIVDRSGGHA